MPGAIPSSNRYHPSKSSRGERINESKVMLAFVRFGTLVTRAIIYGAYVLLSTILPRENGMAILKYRITVGPVMREIFLAAAVNSC